MAANEVDLRGSKDQQLLYSYLKQLYPTQLIYYEFPIRELNHRIDLYLPYLGLAIEYDGIQHYEFVEHFHKDPSGLENIKYQDKKKSDFLCERGIKLIRIPHKEMIQSAEELRELIETTKYPLPDFEILDDTNTEKKTKLKKQSTQRKEYLKKLKGNT
jgi:hypothetical protein